jgi:hypothetical protein
MAVFGELFVVGYQGYVVKSVHVMVDSIFKSVLVALKRTTHGSPINDEVESCYKDDNENCGDAVAPDVDAFVMEHEQTSDDSSGGVEVDPISIGNILVISHKLGSFLVISDVVSFLIFLVLNKWLLILFLVGRFILFFFVHGNQI